MPKKNHNKGMVDLAIEYAVGVTWRTCLKVSCLILYKLGEWDKEQVYQFIDAFQEWLNAVNSGKPEATELVDEVTKELNLDIRFK